MIDVGATQANGFRGSVATTVEELLCRSRPYGAGLTSVELWCSVSQSLLCVVPGGGEVVICHGRSWLLDALALEPLGR